MAVLGISGLFATESEDYSPSTFYTYSHDAAACLVADGVTLAAVEEERLNRDKHTFRFPGQAARSCLETSGLRLADISHIAFYFEEPYTDHTLATVALDDPLMPNPPARDLIHERLSEALGADLSQVDTSFVSHHETHAASAFYDSGFESSLVVVSDGNAERDGISIFLADHSGLRLLRTYSRADSLGHFYTVITKMIGYRNFDEYKVMGLASFGDASPYRELLADAYSLEPDGRYRLPYEELPPRLLDAGFRPRRAGEEITQSHKDLAAAAQEVLERVSLHVIEHWLRETGSKHLCIAGGVAQNTSLNGRLLHLEGLSGIFIPAAADDAGAALGAAMRVEQEHAPPRVGRPYSRTAYLGAPLGDNDHLRRRLDAWGEFVRYEEVDGLEKAVAAELADGAVVGWVQGRAEFGPRALGNRSILADPRHADNQERVNRLIKKREDYRPFAPVVTSEEADRFFDLSGTAADHSYMGFVVPVWPERRAELGATTHIDGTARVQVLREDQQPRFWRLIKEFGEITDVPVLLNTSFNNDAEPIVQSVDDAVASFITTGLTLLVVGPYLVRRLNGEPAALARTRVEIMPFCRLSRSSDRNGERCELYRTTQPTRTTMVSEAMSELLRAGGKVSDLALAEPGHGELLSELQRLWERRLVRPVPE